jgi:phosphoribosylformylglycinamidine synthase subunit PurQ / glutaminase
MKVSVVVFPGSNCDHDVIHVYQKLLSAQVKSIWHKDTDLGNPDVVVLPGGFSYGDYLRTGALAKLSPVMRSVSEFASKGGKVIGICNGFQILCESGLLPGVLLQNVGMQFLSQFVHIKVERTNTAFTDKYKKGEIITCPIAHGDGNYFADSETISRIEGQGQVVFRYCDVNGKISNQDRSVNPNGSINSIAGICNEAGNVVGLMPHPERASEEIVGFIGKSSGLKMFAKAA